jgi:DNA-binding transcriptional LysR family regulator
MLLSKNVISFSISVLTMDEFERLQRRLRLHNLRVLMLVAEAGSMNKAAERLGSSQPAVSRAISDLEHALGVPLLDRSPRGVEPTNYGRAIIRRGIAVFDELRHGIKDVEFLADPTTGELRFGCAEAMADTLVPVVIDKLTRKYPRLSFHVATDAGPPIFERLAAREVELVISRIPKEAAQKYLIVRELFETSYVVAAGPGNPWLGRRKIRLAEIRDEQWTLPPSDSFGHTMITEAFHASGLDPPRVVATAVSRSMRNRLLATGRFLTMVPGFSAMPHQYPFLRGLPIELPDTRAPVTVATLRNRTLSPLALLFLDTLRDIATKAVRRAKSTSSSA